MPRKDALANRTRAVAAATEVFRREGLSAGVDRIAREAGINVSTLYRNFPSKTELILAVGESLLEPLKVTCAQVLASDAPDVVHRLLADRVRTYREDRALSDAFGTVDLDPAIRRELFALATSAVVPVVERGHADGSLAADLDATDLLIALRMVTSAVASADNLCRDPLTYVRLVATGLRSHE